MSARPRSDASQSIPVNVDNFERAESDMYFSTSVEQGRFGKLGHFREPVSIDDQEVIRINRDTLYSAGVFDLDAGPVTITMPDPHGRFMSLMVIDEDHYVHSVTYSPDTYTYGKDEIGTRYVFLAVRILVNPDDPADVEKVHSLQDSIKVEQKTSGRFEVPNWDQKIQKKVRKALVELGSTIQDLRHAFGPRDEVDPIHHLIATASAWGGNPDKDAVYINVVPRSNDGRTVHMLAVRDVPVDAFWSVTVYNDDGYIPKNDRNVYSFNNITASKDADGGVTIQFGGDPAKAPNCLSIVPGWNYLVRLYRPRPEILNGSWKFPEAQPVH